VTTKKTNNEKIEEEQRRGTIKKTNREKDILSYKQWRRQITKKMNNKKDK